MTNRSNKQNQVVARAHQLAAKQAADLIIGGHLTHGECAEMFTSIGIGVMLNVAPRSEVSGLLRDLANEVERGEDLH